MLVDSLRVVSYSTVRFPLTLSSSLRRLAEGSKDRYGSWWVAGKHTSRI